MDYKVKHLEMIQAVITRLAGNSFQTKQWALALLGVIWGITLKKESTEPVAECYLTCLLILMFWTLSSYYLQQERIFRKMYERAVKDSTNENRCFALTPTPKDKSQVSCLFSIMFSITQSIMFGILMIATLCIHWEHVQPDLENRIQLFHDIFEYPEAQSSTGSK